MDGGTECNNTQSSADLWGHEDPGLLSLSWYISPNNMWERARGIILREGVPFLCSGLHITCSAGLVLAVGSSYCKNPPPPLSLSFSLNTHTHTKGRREPPSRPLLLPQHARILTEVSVHAPGRLLLFDHHACCFQIHGVFITGVMYQRHAPWSRLASSPSKFCMLEGRSKMDFNFSATSISQKNKHTRIFNAH